MPPKRTRSKAYSSSSSSSKFSSAYFTSASDNLKLISPPVSPLEKLKRIAKGNIHQNENHKDKTTNGKRQLQPPYEEFVIVDSEDEEAEGGKLDIIEATDDEENGVEEEEEVDVEDGGVVFYDELSSSTLRSYQAQKKRLKAKMRQHILLEEKLQRKLEQLREKRSAMQHKLNNVSQKIKEEKSLLREEYEPWSTCSFLSDLSEEEPEQEQTTGKQQSNGVEKHKQKPSEEERETTKMEEQKTPNNNENGITEEREEREGREEVEQDEDSIEYVQVDDGLTMMAMGKSSPQIKQKLITTPFSSSSSSSSASTATRTITSSIASGSSVSSSSSAPSFEVRPAVRSLREILTVPIPPSSLVSLISMNAEKQRSKNEHKRKRTSDEKEERRSKREHKRSRSKRSSSSSSRRKKKKDKGSKTRRQEADKDEDEEKRKEEEEQTEQEDENEDECYICKRDGELLCCDDCSLSFHLHCLQPPMKTIPEGRWSCPVCSRAAAASNLNNTTNLPHQSPSSTIIKSHASSTPSSSSLINRRQPLNYRQQLGIRMNHNFCDVCLKKGDLLCCEGCPQAFHLACLGLSQLPSDVDWFCARCNVDRHKKKTSATTTTMKREIEETNHYYYCYQKILQNLASSVLLFEASAPKKSSTITWAAGRREAWKEEMETAQTLRKIGKLVKELEGRVPWNAVVHSWKKGRNMWTRKLHKATGLTCTLQRDSLRERYIIQKYGFECNCIAIRKARQKKSLQEEGEQVEKGPRDQKAKEVPEPETEEEETEEPEDFCDGKCFTSNIHKMGELLLELEKAIKPEFLSDNWMKATRRRWEEQLRETTKEHKFNDTVKKLHYLFGLSSNKVKSTEQSISSSSSKTEHPSPSSPSPSSSSSSFTSSSSTSTSSLLLGPNALPILPGVTYVQRNVYSCPQPPLLPSLGGCQCKDGCDSGCPCKASNVECCSSSSSSPSNNDEEAEDDDCCLCCSSFSPTSSKDKDKEEKVIRCANQRLQRGEMAKLYVDLIAKKGIGVRAAQLIPKGTLVAEYVGEVITEEEKNRRSVYRSVQECSYFMELGKWPQSTSSSSSSSSVSNNKHRRKEERERGGRRREEKGGRRYYIDACKIGGLARFINHSCAPNCEVEAWESQGERRMGIFAREDIEPHQEVTYDYRYTYHEENNRLECHCNAPNCKRFL
ncbi:Histone-lysine N-methyltransferase NSD2, variant 3 [Balamuthia mandrillaris]